MYEISKWLPQWLTLSKWLVISEITSNIREICQHVFLRGYLRYNFEIVESLPRIILTGDSTWSRWRMNTIEHKCRRIFGIFETDWLKLFAFSRWWFLGLGLDISTRTRTFQNGVWIASALGQIQTSLKTEISQQWRVIWNKSIELTLVGELQEWSLCLMLQIIDFDWLFESNFVLCTVIRAVTFGFLDRFTRKGQPWVKE